MVAQIILSSKNIVPDGKNSSFVYNFPSSVSFPHHDIALQSINMFYSWTNINSTLGNQKMTVYHPANIVGPTVKQIDIILPEGQYEITDINNYLQFILIQNGCYMIAPGGNSFIFFITITLNTTQYGVNVTTYPFPPLTQFTYNGTTGIYTGNTGTQYAGWTTPVANTQTGALGFCGFVDNGTTYYNPALYIPAKMNEIFGYPADTYTIGVGPHGQVHPPGYITGLNFLYSNSSGGKILTYIGTMAPEVQPNSSVYVSISSIINQYAIPNSIIYALTPQVNFGEQIVEIPPQFAWNALMKGTQPQLRVQFLGADLNPLIILDPNITMIFVIRDRNELAFEDFLKQIKGSK